MGEKNEEDLYRNFSRKDLQGLCKKYGLPANKSNSEMATSLILYLERKNICSKTIWDVSRSDPYPSLWSELQPGVRMNSDGDQRADLRATSSHNGFGPFQKHRNPDKASEDMGLLTKLHRDSNSGGGDADNVFSSVLSSTAEASLPSFTFDVSCEDGIQLSVDLNSTPLDWVESMKAGLDICHDTHGLKSSSCDDRKGPFLMDLHNNAQLEDESCPTTVGTDVAFQAVEFGEASLSRRPEFFRDTIHNLDNLGKEQAMLSSLPKSDTQQRNSGPECFIREENDAVTISNASLATQIRTHNYSGYAMAYDPTSSKTGDDMYREHRPQQTCTLPGPVFKNSIFSGTPFAGIKASPGAGFFQPHDIASSSSRVATCLVSVDQPPNIGLASFNNVKFRGDVPQMWSFEAIDRGQYSSSSSYFMSGLSNAGHQTGTEHCRASISSKCSALITEAQAQFYRSCETTSSLVPYQKLPLMYVNPDTSIKTGNGGVRSSNETRQVAVELPTKDASLSSFNFVGPLDLVVPKKNRSDHPIFDYSNNHNEDVCQSQGSSKDVDGNKRSAFKAFRQMDESQLKPANSDRNEFKMKSNFNRVDDQCESESPVAKILRTSNQFSGDARASRRRSSRPFPK
ncbi:hypothetical protein vseg_014845 [Gypsophila vaccaria]